MNRAADTSKHVRVSRAATTPCHHCAPRTSRAGSAYAHACAVIAAFVAVYRAANGSVHTESHTTVNHARAAASGSRRAVAGTPATGATEAGAVADAGTTVTTPGGITDDVAAAVEV